MTFRSPSSALIRHRAGKGQATRAVLAATFLALSIVAKADVPAPLAAPSVPADFCGTIYNELYSDMAAFNAQLQTPPTWTPISGGPMIYAAALPWANGNTGPQISNTTYLQTVQAQLQSLQALGVKGISIPILFPILYEPFYGSQAAMQPYLTFYTQIAQAARAAGLKVIVDDEIMFSNDIQAGWNDLIPYYSALTWTEYIQARATMAATIAQYVQPDYLSLANEPDTEQVQTGQQNLGIPQDAAQMVAAEIASVQALNLPNPPKLGAGFGTWLTPNGSASLTAYTNAYLALPLDYIDLHLLPVITVNGNNFLNDVLMVSSMAAAAGKPVAIGQAWLSKVSSTEWPASYNVNTLDVQRSRQSFSFWAPLDAYYMQTAGALANYTQMLYLDLQQSFYLSAYQTYGGTVANGGSANCTCTTASCSDYDIMQAENPLAAAADSQSVYTSVGFSFYSQLITSPDTTPPSTPAGLTATVGTSQTALSWTASTDDVGVAGYNLYRCTPPAAGQPCTGALIASTTLPSYNDSNLTSNTLYNYQTQAYDFVNNHSQLSPVLGILTYRTSADAATNLVATAVSAQEIDLSWSPPSNQNGLSEYLIYAGTSPSNMQQIAVKAGTQTTARNLNLSPGTMYYFGIVAMEQGLTAPMTPLAPATTLPLPDPPNNVIASPAPTTVALSWQENLEPGGLPISYYQIWQGTTPGSLAQVGSASTAKYTATGLNPNTTYYFTISAADTGHDLSMPSNQFSVTTAAMPAAPTNVAAVINSATQVTLSWSENVPANAIPIQSYNVFRGSSPAALTQVTTKANTQFIDTSASPGTTYYYAVQAVDTAKDVSPMSASILVTTPPLPAAPVISSAIANSASTVTSTWSESVPPGGLPIQYYKVFRGTAPGSMSQVATRSGLQFIDTGLSANVTYYYSVQALDTGGDNSPMSATVQVTTP